MFGLQPWHLLAILAIALIVFGPSRLPEIGKSIGNSIREFRDAASTAQDEVRKSMKDESTSAPEATKHDDQPKT